MSIPDRSENATGADAISPRADAATIAESLALFLETGDVVEIRAFDVKRPKCVVAGFVRANRIKERASYIAQIADDAAGGCYFTPQQLNPAVFDRSKNMIVETKKRKGETFPRLTHDEDVIARRFLLIDVDPVRADGFDKESATDAEKAAALDVARKVRNYLRAQGWADPLVVDSGNGYHLYYRLAETLPGGRVADSKTDRFARLLAAFALKHKPDGANVDTSVFNASRVMKVPGTAARKGTHTNDRPHRMSSVLEVPDQWGTAGVTLAQIDAVIADLDPEGTAVVVEEPKNESGSKLTRHVPSSVTTGFAKLDTKLERRVRGYLLSGEPAISKRGGHNRTFEAAQGVVNGFLLSREDAIQMMMAHFVPRSPADDLWSLQEIEHKVDEAFRVPCNHPRGWLINAENPNAPGMEGTNTREIATQLMNGTAPAPNIGSKQEGDTFSFLPKGGETDKDPHYLARQFLDRGTNKHIVFWSDNFYKFDGAVYRNCPKFEIEPIINAFLDFQMKRVFDHNAKCHRQNAKEGEKPPEKIPVTRTLTGDVIAALKGKCILNSETTPPAWINGATGHDPRELIAAKNGLVHLPTYAVGGVGAIAPLTPDFFNLNVVPYDVSPSAPEPVEWLKFLDSIWPNDPESVQLLQEWFGYLLTSDTSQQKMLLLFGESGGGKGTILSVLRKLIGEANAVSTDLNTLEGGFGLSNMIGKSVAIIGDARIDTKSVGFKTATTRLLSITGEDPVTVDMKNKELRDVKLTVRFVVATNELFNLNEPAMARRLCALRFRKTFKNNPDLKLKDRLFLELKSIFNWAVVGWLRLQDRNQFTEPASSSSLSQSLATTVSPIGDFVEQHCVVGKGERADQDELFKAWKDYCEKTNTPIGSKVRFIEKLMNFKPGQIDDTQPRIDGKKVRCVDGIALKVEGQQSIDYGDNQEDADLLEREANKIEDL